VSDLLDALTGVTFKVTARCNLNCSYCYVFNKGDTAWRGRPARMSQEVFEAGIGRLREACLHTGCDHVSVTLHGGEPTLLGPSCARRFFEAARHGSQNVADVRLAIQTNGTRLTREWVELFDEHRVDVGVSIDGPAVHDRQRVDHRGRGSHPAVRLGLDLLREGGVPFALLSVVDFDADPLEVHQHLGELQPAQISYLMPHHTHDDVDEVRDLYGPVPCLDWLGPVLDQWWEHGTLRTTVQPFHTMARIILGGSSDLDLFGARRSGSASWRPTAPSRVSTSSRSARTASQAPRTTSSPAGSTPSLPATACMPRRSSAVARYRRPASCVRRPRPAAAGASHTGTSAVQAWTGRASGAATCSAFWPAAPAARGRASRNRDAPPDACCGRAP
jgi:uncharacterized Fe-S cluster-containing radical SAM superfamily protein